MEVYNPEIVDWNYFFASSAMASGNKNYDNFIPRRGAGLGAALRLLARIGGPLLKKAGRAGIQLAKKGAKAALRKGSQMAKEEAINAGRQMLNDLSQKRHAPVTHVVRDRAREGALKFAQRVRRGRGLGSTSKKGSKKSSLGIVKSERPKRGRQIFPSLHRK